MNKKEMERQWYKGDASEVKEIKNQLQQGSDDAGRGNQSEAEILERQINALDNTFKRLINIGFVQCNSNFNTGEKLMRLALKAQSQCRATVSLLNNIKNPRQVVITKQANIANNQQVNNSEKNKSEKN